MNINLRSAYLQRLGIIEWRLRKTATQSAQIYSYRLHAEQGTILLLVVINEQFPLETTRQLKLLKAIVNALQSEWHESELLRLEDFSEIKFLSEITTLIFFGEAIMSDFLKSQELHPEEKHVIRTHDLATLLKEPLKKAETWRDLYPLRSVIKV